MKAIVITRSGGPEVLALTRLPDPVPGPGEVLVRIRATAVNRADLLQRLGRYPAPPGAPADIPGLEFAGVVEALGPGVEAPAAGSRVMGLLAGGGYAELVAVAAGLCLPVPDGLGWDEAAAVPEVFATAYAALHPIGAVRPGEAVAVTAAASGVGLAALQLARVAGARVIALSRAPERRARLERLGAHAALDPARADLAPAIRRAAGGGGADLLLDLVGGATLPVLLDAAAERARVVLIGLLGGTAAHLDLQPILRKRLRLAGTILRTRPLAERVELTAMLARRLLPLLGDGRVRPLVGRRFALSAAAAAHEHAASATAFGKTVLIVAPEAG